MHPRRGPGAIELTARYERLAFTQESRLGEGWAATVGVNWYLNSFTRLMLNGIHWHTDNRSGDFTGGDDGETVTLRAQVSY
ncbi:porin [Cystobacter fuscus]